MQFFDVGIHSFNGIHVLHCCGMHLFCVAEHPDAPGIPMSLAPMHRATAVATTHIALHWVTDVAMRRVALHRATDAPDIRMSFASFFGHCIGSPM